jgi:imidazolonepropionase-like amidohydrolase
MRISHFAWHFGPDERYQPRDDSPQTSLGYAIENADATLMGGFTTVQSVGSHIDKDLRTAINRGALPGARVLTSLRAINDPCLPTGEIWEAVRKMADGADVIKIASKRPRDGGGQTLSEEQIDAACGEAKAQHLRAIVHVYQPETIMQVADAGCTAAEHGTTPNLRIVLGTDAVAEAHGHNAEEIVVRGQDPMAAIGSRTSLSAQSLNLGDKTGTLALGMEADIIEVDGDPLKDIAAPARCFRHEWWQSL